MSRTLKSDGPVGYSKREHDLFALLKNGDVVNTKDIVKHYYRKKTLPFNKQKIILDAMTTLKRKVAANKEPFRIVSTKRSGPIPMSFWVEEKKR